MNRIVVATVACVPLMAGCLSASVPEYRYFTLDMRPTAELDTPFWIRSVRISPAEALNKNEIMIRTSPTTIEYYALDRWASGLEEQLGEKLRAEFAQSANAGNVVDIDGTLLAFEQVDTDTGASGRIKVEIDAEVNGEPAVAKIYTAEIAATDASASAVVVALSRATEAVVSELAVDLAAASGNS